LTTGITITAPADFQISTTNNSGYTSTLTLPLSGSTVANTTIFVRFTPSGLGARGGNITHESEGAETRTVAVSGTGANAFTISGTVTNNTGTGLAGVPVTLASGETPIATTTTDSNGNYSFTGVAGGGEYIVNATSAGFTFTPASQTFSNLSENRTANFSVTAQIVVSEFRFRGTTTTGEFIELYNQTNQVVGIGGWTIVSSGGTVLHTFGSASIPARGYYLIAGTGYNLAAAADATLSTGADIPDGTGIALFNNATNFVTGTRLDAVGFNGAQALYIEGSGLAPAGGITTDSEFSFVRRLTSGFAQDTNDNAADFVLVATDPTIIGNNAVLGAPGPQNRISPTQRNAQLKASLIDPQCAGFGAATSGCARVRDSSPVPNGGVGTLSIRPQVHQFIGTGRDGAALPHRGHHDAGQLEFVGNAGRPARRAVARRRFQRHAHRRDDECSGQRHTGRGEPGAAQWRRRQLHGRDHHSGDAARRESNDQRRVHAGSGAQRRVSASSSTSKR
jgi:hypothetical protein